MDSIGEQQQQEAQFQEDSDAYIQAKSQEFLQNLYQLYGEFVANKKQALIFMKFCRFLANIAYNLSKKELSPTDQRLEIAELVFKEDGFILCLLSLGYNLDFLGTGNIVLTLQAQPSKKVLDRVMEVMKCEYLQNQELLAAVQNERRQLEEKNKSKEENPVRYVYPSMTLSEQKVNMDIQMNNYRKMMKERHQQRSGIPASQDVNHGMNDGGFMENPKPAEERKEGPKPNGQAPSGWAFERMGREQQKANLDAQLNDYRAQMRNRYRRSDPDSDFRNYNNASSNNFGEKENEEEEKKEEPKVRRRMMTGMDIEEMRIREDQVKFGKYALELTNEFRVKCGLRPLAWNQELCDISMVHSKNMAIGKVPFSHEGFESRKDKISFKPSAVAENIGGTSAYPPPEVVVKGWIESPGHRKNLLSETNVCGIACYRGGDGTWYFTQMFAQKEGNAKNIVIIILVIIILIYQYGPFNKGGSRRYYDM